jgi:hypothetical protein
MTDAPTTPERAPDPQQHQRAWPLTAVVLAVVFGLLFAWFLYQAIGNLVNVPAAYEQVGYGDRIPWGILLAGVGLPVVLFAGAAWLGLRRSLSQRVILFAAALGATAATSFSLYVASAYLVSMA